MITMLFMVLKNNVDIVNKFDLLFYVKETNYGKGIQVIKVSWWC